MDTRRDVEYPQRHGPVLASLRISITGGEIDRSLLVDLADLADRQIANRLAWCSTGLKNQPAYGQFRFSSPLTF